MGSWCCHLEGIWCSTRAKEPIIQPIPTMSLAPVTPTAVPYNCSEGNSEAWSSEKRSWCCQILGRGCKMPQETFTTFCDSGNSKEWKRFKRAWCCRHKGLGCEIGSIYERGNNITTSSNGSNNETNARMYDHTNYKNLAMLFNRSTTKDYGNNTTIVRLS